MDAQRVSGVWKTEAPLTPEQAAEDKAVLEQLHIPDGMAVRYATVWVNGREYEWQGIFIRRDGYR